MKHPYKTSRGMDNKRMKPRVYKLHIGGGRYVEVSTDHFFGSPMTTVTCFCGHEAPGSSNKELAIDWMATHIEREHPEALQDFDAMRQKEKSEKYQQALLFLQGSSTILSGNTNLTPREEKVGRYTRKKGTTRNTPNPGNISHRVGPRPTLLSEVPPKSEGAKEVHQEEKPVHNFGPLVLKYFVERKCERVFISDLLESEEFRGLTKKQVQNAILHLVSVGEPIRVVARGNVWVFDPDYRAPTLSRDPVVQRIVEQKYGDDTPTHNLESLSMIVLSRRRDSLVLLDPSGKIWKAEPLHV